MDHPDPQAVFGFALGELTGDRRRVIADHVRACESCAQTVMELTSRPPGGSPRPAGSRFSPAERIRDDDERRQFSRPVRALLILVLVGFVAFMIAGAFLVLNTPAPFSAEFNEKEYAMAVAEGNYLASQGHLPQALSSLRHAQWLYSSYWGDLEPELLLKIKLLERRIARREGAQQAFDLFVVDLEKAEAADLPVLLRRGYRLREDYRPEKVPWMDELERILARLEQVGKSSSPDASGRR